MSRITQLIAELRKRGINGQVTEEQAVDALRSLPDSSNRPPAKDGFDDRNDYHMELLQMNMQYPQMLNLKPAVVQKNLPRTTNKAGQLKSVDSLIEATVHTSPTSLFKTVLSNVISDSKVAVADLISPAGPVLRIRVQALICRNDDGKLTNGSPGQTKEQMASSIAKTIDAVNELFNGSGIEFVFYPSSDIDVRHDTRLNQDFQLNASYQTELFAGKLTQTRIDELANLEGPLSTFAYRNQITRQYTNKLVLLFAEGTNLTPAPIQAGWRRCKKCESLFFGPGQASSHCPSGGRHDGDMTISYTPYVYLTDAFSVDTTSSDLQKGWRYCNKCQSLFFTGAGGKCPSGGQHDQTDSGFYVLDSLSSFGEAMTQIADKTIQSGWRWCNKCQMLYLGSHQATSNCSTGGQHSQEGSGNYVLLSEASSPRYIVGSPAGFGFSGAVHGFVKLTSSVPTDTPGIKWYAKLISHEVGHYLSLWHTFGFTPGLPLDMAGKSAQEKLAFLQEEVRIYLESKVAEGVVTRKNILDALDGNKGSDVFDTPADVGEVFFLYVNLVANANSNECGPIGTYTIPLSDGTTVAVSSPRSNIMSYFKHCMTFDHTFSPDQISRMRKYLIQGFRRPLVAVQLGDTTTPSERMCAIWSPNSNGQAYVTGWAFPDFKKKCEEMVAANFRLTYQQAYTRNGITVFDGIFNPGKTPESKIWGWAIQDFKLKDIEMNKTGWGLIHFESYLLPTGEVRINAIWNQANLSTTWVQGYSQADLDKQLVSWKKQGLQPVHINGWQLPTNEIRYDAIARPINVDYPYFLGWAEADFKKLYDDMWKKNHKLLLLDCTRINDGTLRFSGVFTPDTQAQFVMWNATREQIRQTYDEMWALGMKLRTMNMVQLKA